MENININILINKKITPLSAMTPIED